MAEEKTDKIVDGVAENDPTPYFKIGAQPFQTGLATHNPGDVIPWEVPKGWDEKKNGRHYASYGPSVTWTPLNKAASAIMASHKEKVRKATEPKPDPVALQMKAMQESFTKLAEAQDRQAQVLEALLEKLTSKK